MSALYFSTGSYQKKSMARKGYEHLLKKMDGSPRGDLYVGKIGFATELYMEKLPTLIKRVSEIADRDFEIRFAEVENNLSPQAFKIAQRLKKRETPYTLLSTDDQQITIRACVFGPSRPTLRFLNMDADSVWFVYKGSGFCDTTLGRIFFESGDFVYIPARICYKFSAIGNKETDKVIMIGMEGASGFQEPQPRVFDNNDIPYSYEDIRLPDPCDMRDLDMYDCAELTSKVEDFYVFVKRNRRWSRVTYPFTPFQCVAWKGTVYPFAVHESDLHFSYTTDIHPDPSNFAMFAAKDFSAVISVLKGRFVHSIPYNHLNTLEEFLFYGKEYEARKGSVVGEGGDATLHPQGVWHGPQPKALREWKRPASPKDIPFVDDLAIMFEASKPLLLCEDGADIAVSGYERSWYEDWEEYQELQEEHQEL
ncbi:MAG: homogentisate 1,2-dioxygenase [bacterium]|nr:homogentisate 1,2-dioxygenase [bacterium]